MLKNENKSCLNELKFCEIRKIKHLIEIKAVYFIRNLKIIQDNTITGYGDLVLWKYSSHQKIESWKVKVSGITSYFLYALSENCHFEAKDQNYSIFSLNIYISYQARRDGNSPTKEERMNPQRIFFQQYWLQRIVEAEIEASVDENAKRRGKKTSIESFDTVTFHCFNVYIYDAIELAFSRSTFGVCG